MSSPDFQLVLHEENVHTLMMCDTNYHMLTLATPRRGTNDYEELINKPSINNIVLIGNITLSELFAGGLIIDGGDSHQEGG